jgi:hypothetical protein
MGKSALTLDRVRRLQAVLPSLGPDGQWLADIFAARVAGRIDLVDRGMGMIACGGISIARADRLADRDQRIRQHAQQLYPGMKPGQQAQRMADDATRFDRRLWPTCSMRQSAPAHFSNRDAALFDLFRTGDFPLSARTISRILRHPIAL